MSIHEGEVSLDDDQVPIPVTIGLDRHVLIMSSGGTEVGQWADGEYSITHEGNGVYTIVAENEELRFTPSNPELFAVDVRRDGEPSATPGNAMGRGNPPSQEEATVEVGEAPAPRPLTLVGFYLLAASTAALGLWALASIFL